MIFCITARARENTPGARGWRSVTTYVSADNSEQACTIGQAHFDARLDLADAVLVGFSEIAVARPQHG